LLSHRRLTSFCCALALLAGLVTPVLAEQPVADTPVLELLGDEQAPPVVARSPRPASKIAENVTVITAAEIARINAHTLAEVLQTVPGIQLDQVQTPGSSSFFSILSATSRHILVEIDGVPQNFISADQISSIGSIPVQMIERVEIVKGAASAAWGSALGGVVNIITKSPDAERPVGGMASASAGERQNSDLRAEVSGTVDRAGYYLSGGNLYSHGLTPGTNVNLNHGFGKLTYNLPEQGTLTLGFDIRDNAYGLGDYALFDYHDTGGDRRASTYLNLQQPLAERLTLELTGQLGRRELSTKWGALTVPDLFLDADTREEFHGARMRLTWGDRQRNLVAGMEYEHTGIRQRDTISYPDPVSNFDLTLDRWAAYLNGAYTVGRLTVLPGIRFDHSNLFSDAFSYTLGATLQLSDSTLLRSYAARGFSLPNVNNLAISNGSRELQHIWTVQAGIESTAIPYLWLKGTLFYNDISKIQEWDTSTVPATATLKSQIRKGFELEAKTSPVYGLSLSGGYNFNHFQHENLGDIGAPQQGAKLALNYSNHDLGLLGALTGNYVWWDLADSSNVSYRATIWDLFLTQKLAPAKELSPELFFSVRNLFNSAQFQVDIRPNAPRWAEIGVRFRF